ncbi:MAG: glycine--tRNA ligase subunit beta [Deferribacterota bacterium]|nr:glycine--tRNA ligase subunit beta [Deferribacterota bacterium]
MGYYLFEVGVEELPVTYLNIAIKHLSQGFANLLDKYDVEYGKLKSSGTPRRVYVYIEDLAESQKNKRKEIIGPPVNVAFNKEGELNEIGLKFIKSKGINKNNIKIIERPKGKYLGGIVEESSKKTVSILLENIVNIVLSTPFPKTMRWDDSKIYFARPIRWLLSIYNGELLPIKLGNLEADIYTWGHRFLDNNKIEVYRYNDYERKLEEKFVIVNKDKRKERVKDFIGKAIEKYDLSFEYDKELIEEVVNLVEYPEGVISTFDRKFLELPEEVLITTMKNHQKFFYLREKSGKLTNRFIGISNIVPLKKETIEQGYSKVLKARLSDALFFFEKDKKKSLLDNLYKLKGVVFQERLGTIYDKTLRIERISEYLYNLLGCSCDIKNIKRIARLSKCDLITEMVLEFPELQGYMGKIYTSIQGENNIVSEGIYEHYLPRHSSDELPTTIEGAIVSISDKIDTIVGNFLVGNIPTGNLDPYALRRDARGIISIICEKELDFNIFELVNFVVRLYNEYGNFDVNRQDVVVEVVDFIKQRLKQMLISQDNITPDIFEAVSDKYNSLCLLKEIALTLNEFKASSDFKIVTIIYKRINNIILKNNWSIEHYDTNLFDSEYEWELHSIITKFSEFINIKKKEKGYRDILEKMATFSKPLNNFFDNVLVIDKNNDIRENRLALLLTLRNTINSICDLSKIIY